jgi:hypothetical protein
MGCSSSTTFTVNDSIGQDEIAVMFFELICLGTYDINVFYTLFSEIDLRGTGFITVDDLYFKYRCVITSF